MQWSLPHSRTRPVYPDMAKIKADGEEFLPWKGGSQGAKKPGEP